jgi:hypothetical protein
MKKKRKKEKRVRVCENVTRSGCHSQALRAVCSLVQQKANPRGASIIGVLKQLSQDCMRECAQCVPEQQAEHAGRHKRYNVRVCVCGWVSVLSSRSAH